MRSIFGQGYGGKDVRQKLSERGLLAMLDVVSAICLLFHFILFLFLCLSYLALPRD